MAPCTAGLPVYWGKVCYFRHARQLQKQEADLEEGRHHMRFVIGVIVPPGHRGGLP